MRRIGGNSSELSSMFTFSATGLAAASDVADRTLSSEQNFQQQRSMAPFGDRKGGAFVRTDGAGKTSLPDQQQTVKRCSNGNE